MKSTLPDAELQRYRDSGSVIELQPGETLFEQGSPPGEMYAVLRGVLAVIMDGVQVAEVSEGQVVGEMAFLLGEKRTATVRALTVCEVHAVSPQKMRMLLQHPDVAIGLIQLFARRVEAANRALKVRTETALNDRLAREEAQRQLAETETRLAAALGNLNPANARIAELERALTGLGYELKPEGALTKRFVRPTPAPPEPLGDLELDLEEDLATLAPPPAAEPPPLPSVPKLKDMSKRLDGTQSYATEPTAVAVTDPDEGDAFAEVHTDEMTVVEEPATGPVQAPRQGAIPVGARTQTMVAFDPDAYRQEVIVDERGSRPSNPSLPAVLDSETDTLLAELSKEILAVTPGPQPKKKG